MKFLITEYFFKTVPKEKMEKAVEKLYIFYNKIKENLGHTGELPGGYYIKKIQGVESLFEFRVDSGDRIFYIFNKRNEDREQSIIFILYSAHDDAVKKAKRKDINSNLLEEFSFKEENNEDEIAKELYRNWRNIITYEMLEDYEFKNNKDIKEYKYYYLNNEQYNCLISMPPYFIAGSAGSGKSTLTLRKVLNLEENNLAYDYKKILYLTTNRYLKDNIETQYTEFRNKKNEKLGEFYTVRDFFIKKLKIDKKKVVGYEDFKRIVKNSYPNMKKLGVSIEDIYSDVNGILKGIMLKDSADNWNRDLSKEMISLDEYLNLSNKYSVLEEKTKEIVYKIAEKYNETLRKEGLYDLNDLAIEFLKLGLKYDFIIIDEIQDLTEVQIYALFSLAKERENVFVAGDIHQMINSTYFSFERLKNLFYSTYNLSIGLHMLTKNYRSSKNIVNLANHFSDLRSKYIGNLGADDYKEIAVQNDGKVSLSKVDFELISKAQEEVNYAIVVPDGKTKLELYEKTNKKYRIFTIYEIKGLEYRDVICYNLSTLYQEEWKKIFSKEVKQDQRYRKFFNIFYVGITRAQENLIIMEENTKENAMLDSISSFLTKDEKISIEIKTDNTKNKKKNWLEEGIKLYKMENISEAQHAFEMANEPTWILEREIDDDIESLDFTNATKKILSSNLNGKQSSYKKKLIDKAILEMMYLVAIEKNQLFGISYKEKEIKEGIKKLLKKNDFSIKDMQKILNFYKQKKDYLFVGDILIGLKRYKEALNHYQNINNVQGVKLARKMILIEKFGNMKNFDRKVEELDTIILDKSINTFGKKDKLTPLQRALLRGDVDLFNMVLELGGNLETYIGGNQTLPEALFRERWIDIEIIEDFLKVFVENNVNFNTNNYFKIFLDLPKRFKELYKLGYLNKEFYFKEIEKNLKSYDEELLLIKEKEILFQRKVKLLRNIIKNLKIKKI